MAPRAPKTKEQVLLGLVEDTVKSYFHQQKGISAVSKDHLSRILEKAEHNKQGSYSAYYLIKALVNIAEGNYAQAEANCENASRLAPDDVVILANYSTILLRNYKFSEAKNILLTLVNKFKDYKSNAVISNIFILPLLTLDTDFMKNLDDVLDDGWHEYQDAIDQLAEDINAVDISKHDYVEFMKVLDNFVNLKTRQPLMARFSIENGLSQNLMIEVFLEVTPQEAVYLTSEFEEVFMNYAIENERYDLLGKILVFFKCNTSRDDGRDDPKELYLGMNEELLA